MSPGGELHVLRVGPEDAMHAFTCVTTHALTHATQHARKPARIIVSGEARGFDTRDCRFTLSLPFLEWYDCRNSRFVGVYDIIRRVISGLEVCVLKEKLQGWLN